MVGAQELLINVREQWSGQEISAEVVRAVSAGFGRLIFDYVTTVMP